MKKILLVLLIGHVVGCGESENKSWVAEGPHKFERAMCTAPGKALDKECYRSMLESTQTMDRAVNDSLNRGRELECTDKYGNVSYRCITDKKAIDEAVRAEK